MLETEQEGGVLRRNDLGVDVDAAHRRPQHVQQPAHITCTREKVRVRMCEQGLRMCE